MLKEIEKDKRLEIKYGIFSLSVVNIKTHKSTKVVKPPIITKFNICMTILFIKLSLYFFFWLRTHFVPNFHAHSK